MGDPLERDPEKVREDVEDGYVSVERARKDYGVVLRCVDPDLAVYEVDYESTARERAAIRAQRRAWLEEDPEVVRKKFLDGEIDLLDVIRRYGVILDLANMTVLKRSTQQFRAMLKRRAAAYWKEGA